MNRILLKDAIEKLVYVAPKRATIEILKYFWLKTEDGKLRIATNDIEIFLSISVPYEDGNEIECCVPARQFQKVVQSIHRNELTLRQTAKSLIVETDSTKTVLKTLPADEFPIMWRPEGASKIKYEIIKDIFRLCGIAYNELSTNYTLCGINIYQDGNTITGRATNGFVASKYECETEGEPRSFNVLVKPPASKILQLFNEESGDIYMKIDRGIHIFNEEFYLFTQSLDYGKYPDITKFFEHPKDKERIEAKVNTRELAGALRRARLFAANTSNIIEVEISGSKLIISARDDIGEERTEIDAEHIGDDIKFAVNCTFIIEYAGVANKETTFVVYDKHLPIFLNTEDAENFNFVMAPMHLGK